TDLHVQWRRWRESTFPVYNKSQIIQIERLRLGFIEHSQDRNCGSNLETAIWRLMFFSWHPNTPEHQVWISLERNLPVDLDSSSRPQLPAARGQPLESQTAIVYEGRLIGAGSRTCRLLGFRIVETYESKLSEAL